MWQVVVWYKEHAASLQEELLCQVCTATRAGNKKPKTRNIFLYRLLVLTMTICHMSHRKSSYNGASSRTCTCDASVLARIGITFKVSMTMYPSAVTNNADNSSVTWLSTRHCEGSELCKLLSQCLAVSLLLGMWQNSMRFYLALSNVMWVTQRDV